MKTPQHLLVTLILAFFTLSAARLYGENYIYVTNNGTITITSYTGPGGAVNVPETINGLPVTAITGTNYVISPPFYVGFTNRVGAFAGNTNVTSINIPAGVVSIWPEAFDGCTNLSALAVDAVSPAYSSVGGVLFDRSKATLIRCPPGMAGSYTIPDGATTIAIAAFKGCPSLTSVTIPNTVGTIGYRAFTGCAGLTSVTIPGSVTKWETQVIWPPIPFPGDVSFAFEGCTNLTTAIICDGVSDIPPWAFYTCYRLKNVSIPNSVTSIREGAFGSCTSLETIAVPASVTEIRSGVAEAGMFGFSGYVNLGAFSRCTSLAEISVDALNTNYSSVNGALLDKSQTKLIGWPAGRAGAYKLPSGVATIVAGAFSACTNLTRIIFPSSVTNIENVAFDSCTRLRGVYFEGDAPRGGSLSGYPIGSPEVVYYLPGTTGWGLSFGGRPTALWLPELQCSSLHGETNELGFAITWGSDRTVAVEASTNLSTSVWLTTETLTLTNGFGYFSDPEWRNNAGRFYRVRSL